MAYFGKDIQNVSASSTIRITSAVSVETYTVYVIEVTLGTYSWTVRHRYSDFHELHEKLVAGYKLDKSLLPPKKLFGNQTESFIKKRQNELEIYLQTVLYYLAPKIPTVLAFFLDFNRYEIHGITQALAEELYNRGESILQTLEMFEMTPLQLFALTERLKLPEPTCDSGDVKKDIGHILDFITRVKALKITGSSEPYESSNIDMNQLNFDLTLFKSLQKVEIVNCSPKAIGGLDTIKQTLQTLNISRTLSSFREFLLQDVPYWRADDGTLLVEYWSGITSADLSVNYITEIDDSVQLMPKVESLNLSNNKVETIEHLQWLSQLTYLDLSSNLLRNLDSLHTKLGNLKTLKLANNLVESLHGFSKLFSLTTLDISNNEVAKISEVKHLSSLPCLENLFMVGNPVTITLDYRTKVLELFGDRVSEVILDNERPDQKELDTVAVLQALQKSKDNKEKVKRLTPKKVPSSASLAESAYSYSGSTPPDITGEKTFGINPSPGNQS
ncbi:nischarin-like isoform X2 [Gigantopelta aegis]|uniref:nischarin-like isoform X2 n=1 Tax=Gigantopelta aegis TaxID=1735272 RepID=UPI001B88CA18|nr:nischarin-like isoform X2 [Gigantopelta aegis]